MAKTGYSWALDISCSEQDIKLSEQDLGIVDLSENSINKSEASFMLTFPSSYKGRNFSYSALLIGNVEHWSLLTELQTHEEGKHLTVFVSKNPRFKEKVSVSVSYGQCLTQTIQLP